MPSEAVQLNTRINRKLKLEGDEVFARNGLSSSEVVRAVWSYAAQHQDLPEFMKRENLDAERERRRRKDELIGRYAGMLREYIPSVNVGADTDRRLLSCDDIKALRDEMYDQMAEREMAAMHGGFATQSGPGDGCDQLA